MNKLIFSLILALLFVTNNFSQEQREVLVEIFTNSHCGLCPVAHNVLDDYIANSPNGDKLNFIYYHMVYPYPTDSLYQQSSDDSDARHDYYNPIAATPRGFFDGSFNHISNTWAATLDNLTQTQSPLNIQLSGTKSNDEFDINAQITRTGEISNLDLVVHFVVVENVIYSGNNGISLHKQVMRKMLPSATGYPFSITLNETKDVEQSVTPDPIWNNDSLKVVVFVQSTGAKTVYQSEIISYADLTLTALDVSDLSISDFNLSQNYPNPFNPNTTIRFTISDLPADRQGLRFTSLKVYDVLGNEVATLVNEEKPVGKYEIEFDGTDLTSGVYFYRLLSGNYTATKKLILLK